MDNIELSVTTGNTPFLYTNREVRCVFYNMVRGWFVWVCGDYNDLSKELLRGKLKEMSEFLTSEIFITCQY